MVATVECRLASLLLVWYRVHGRHDLPWQQHPDPWRVWVSEIMLQQTQVVTVIPYFERFMARFPSPAILAKADMDEVLHVWSGLGYYARARNLKRSAERIVQEYNGRVPDDFAQLNRLPGIGPSTAGAILSFACGQRRPILDGNVKRVLARCFAVSGWPGASKVARRLWALAESCTPHHQFRDYNQAIMDLGAKVCLRRNPRCAVCPLAGVCQAASRGTQDRYPEARPRKPLPLRQACFLILERPDGAIFLQRRSPNGIWGGLWCFPECPDEEACQDWVRREFGFISRESAVENPAPFYHRFSHYRLRISPVRLMVSGFLPRCREHSPHCWYTVNGGQALGLPKPVDALLRAL